MSEEQDYIRNQIASAKHNPAELYNVIEELEMDPVRLCIYPVHPAFPWGTASSAIDCQVDPQRLLCHQDVTEEDQGANIQGARAYY